MKCGDCQWLNKPRPQGRGSTSCSDLGELPENETCQYFKPADPVNLNSHMKFTYQDVMLDSVLDAFEVQKAADIVIHSVAVQLQQQGYTIDFDPKFFLSSVQKLTELLVVHKLCLGLGLGNYEDAIISHMISDRFSRRDIQGTLPSMVSKGNSSSMESIHNDIQSLLSEAKRKT